MNVPPSVEDDSGSNLASPATHAGIQLKLLASQDAFEKVRELPAVVRHARNRGTFRRLESVYYDTAELLLFRRGISLRVRRSGKRFVQTLKVSPADGRSAARRQWEVPVDGIVPDLTRLHADEVGDPIETLTESSLVPAFTIKIRRHAQWLDLPDALLEITFDEGTIEAHARQESLSEIKLKLRRGNAGAVFDLGEQLLDAASLQFGTSSKVERGYALAFDAPQSATKAELPDITTEHVIDDVIALLTGSCRRHLLRNHTVVQREPDPEGVHQMRVALRRLRTICVMFRRDIPSPVFQAINVEAEWLMQQLGRAREWDVFAETAAHLVDGISDVDFTCLREVVEQQRRLSYGAVRATLADSRCSRFLLMLGRVAECRDWRNGIDSEALALLSQPMSELTNRILARLHRKALKRGVHFRHLDFAGQHDLRIDLKKLRYAAEFLLPFYADHAPAKRYVKRLVGLQSDLGHVCDIARSRMLLETIRQNDKPDLHVAISAIAGWQARDQMVVTKTLRKRWRRFKTVETFWDQ